MISLKRSEGSWTFTAIVAAWIFVLCRLGAGVSASVPPPAPVVQATSPATAAGDPLTRGKYLVNAMGCNDCHTPMKMGANGPEHDMTRMLSGHPESEKMPPPPAPSGPWVVSAAAIGTAWSGPWGMSYTRNLTPDPETGLGSWTEQQFVETIRNGRHQGRGRQLLPPMPWQAFRNLSDEDLKAIYAYLRTIPAIKNKVPDPIIAAPKP